MNRFFSLCARRAYSTTQPVEKLKGMKQILYENVFKLNGASSNQIVAYCNEQNPGLFRSKRLIKLLLQRLVAARKVITDPPKDGKSTSHTYRLTKLEAGRKTRKEERLLAKHVQEHGTMMK